jgi:DNA-binding CsgD family transcriptional regulator
MMMPVIERADMVPQTAALPSTSAICEQMLNLIDRVILLLRVHPDERIELRFANRAARRLLGGALPVEIEGACRRSLKLLGAAQGPMQDAWTWAGRSLRARVSRLRGIDDQLVAVEITADATSARDGTAALADAFQLSMPDARLLRLVWRGFGNEQIGGTLGIPAGTVKSRLYRLFRRLGVRTRAQAAVLAAGLLARVPEGLEEQSALDSAA